MKIKAVALKELEEAYRKLSKSLEEVGYISRGSVYERKGKTGSTYQWTWKDREQKTVGLTVTKEQYEWLKEAIANHRRMEKILGEMRKLSHQIMLQRMEDVKRRKPMDQRCLDIK